jgi:uncharacterized surface protein with fasciclin (FAS1) repeats
MIFFLHLFLHSLLLIFVIIFFQKMRFHLLAPLAMAAAVAAQSTQVLTTLIPAPTSIATDQPTAVSSEQPTAISSEQPTGTAPESSGLVSGTGLPPVAQPTVPVSQNQTILEHLISNGTNATTFAEIANSLGANNTLIQALNSTTGNYTVFVPSDGAIQSANMTLINETYGGWGNVAAYHVINQTIDISNLTTQPQFYNTLLTNETVSKFPNGTGLPIGLVRNFNGSATTGSHLDIILPDNTTSNGTIEVGYGYDQYNDLSNENFTATNGMIYYIDKVLLPPVSPTDTLAKKSSTDMIVSAIEKYNLTTQFNNASGVS